MKEMDIGWMSLTVALCKTSVATVVSKGINKSASRGIGMVNNAHPTVPCIHEATQKSRVLNPMAVIALKSACLVE